jgi:multidrug resistance protein MdtO
VMVLPDLAPIPPESLVEFVLWIWLCVTLGLAVNVGVQLLLAPGDPLTLLLRELDARLHAVENIVRDLAGAPTLAPGPTGTPLDALATAGMSRPLALLKTASLTNAVARQRHETLATTITLVDRLVTDAGALRLLASSTSITPMRDSLSRVADGCADARRAVAERRWPEPWAAAPPSASTPPPLADMERTLEQISVVSRIEPPKPTTKEPGPHLLLPDATTNPEYVQFAVKGALAALICYVLFIGFDYPGIYTSVVTCFVVSLSTIGSSNQKGLLRFGGAALGGVMGVYALVYAFPNVDGLGGFWLVFATGTAVAAWINFGSPRISYGGYQTGLAFYKATLQGLGPALSATVVRDRLIGVAFGLIVFGIVEHVLWPVRAADRMHARLADVFGSLAAFARALSQPPGDVDARRRLISQQVADVQGFIESSKFESGAGADAETMERRTAGAQTVFLVLLAIAREATAAARPPEALHTATIRVDGDVAAILDGVAARVQNDGAASAIDVDRALAALERSLAAQANAGADGATYAGARALYRELAVAVTRVASDERRPMSDVALSHVA